ncbi:MAG: LysR family transcriptional regulator [Solirubrobacteraceae bacterium]
MELRQLRYLVALSEELSFTAAAAKTNIAQPALSRQIHKLEDELGISLVDRTSRRVRMTRAGQQLVERARVIMHELDDARADVLQETQLMGGRLAIGMTQTPGPLDIARLLHDFHARYPAIELAVREELSVSVAERLRVGEIDLGIVSEIQGAARNGLDLEWIAGEPLVFALHAKHPLAGRAEVDLTELSEESFILFPEGATIRDTFSQLAAERGINPHVAFVTTATERMRELVSLGLGVGLLPFSDAARPGYRLAAVQLRGRSLSYNVFLARRAGRRESPTARAMGSLIQTASRSQ